MSVKGDSDESGIGPKMKDMADKMAEEMPEDSENLIESQKEIIGNEVANVKETFSEMSGDTRGQGSMMEKGVDMAVGVLVVGLLTAYLLPIAISEIAGVDTTSWGNAEAQLFGLLPIFFVLAIVLFVVNKAT